jgi:ATP-binding cassette, subfamily C (CFTR/MRP), member 1
MEFTNGKITNLMSTDTSRIDFAAGYCHIGWVAGIQVSIILAILIVNIGPSALAGFGLLILSAPIIGRIVRKLARKRFKSTKFTDARVRITQEILNSMRVIKYYAWEKSFLAKVIDLRESELKIVRFLLLMRAGVNAVSMTIPVYASILAFVTYSLTGHGLNPANIFSSLTLFNLLRMPLMFLPLVFAACTDAWVSLGRMQNMLLASELEDTVSIDQDAEFAISVEKGRFVWEVETKEDKTKKEKRKKSPPTDSQTNAVDEIEMESEEEEEAYAELADDRPNNTHLNADLSTFQVEEHEQIVEVTESHAMDTSAVVGPQSPEAIDTMPLSRLDSTPDSNRLQRLKDISFQIKRGEFIVIVGEIGAGKSSLLAALVGEMRRTEGIVKLGGTVGFCPQTAWIQNATVRNNILFGKEFDREKYDRVIRDCALEADLEMLPNGDATEIGERGITVSGGQKARINIARAAYNDADIILLDDPLSAVDAHVGRQLLDACICGLMAGKTRILVTHQLHVLPRADRILCMHQGKIVEQGTYDELISHGGDFSRLVEEYGGKEEEEKEEKEEAEDDPIEESIEDVKEKKHKQKENVLMQVEERATGSVKWGVYAEYARAGGGIWVIPVIIIIVLCCNGVNISTSLWLSYWTSNKYGLSEGAYVGIYAALGASQAIFFFIFGYALTMTGNKAAGNLHAKVWLLKFLLTPGH